MASAKHSLHTNVHIYKDASEFVDHSVRRTICSSIVRDLNVAKFSIVKGNGIQNKTSMARIASQGLVSIEG